jgi:cytochrome c
MILTACGSGSDSTSSETKDAEGSKSTPVEAPSEVKQLLARNTCLGCHKVGKRLIGPSYIEIAQRVENKQEILDLIRHPKPERWPDYPPMNPIPISDDEGDLIAEWIMSLKQD